MCGRHRHPGLHVVVVAFAVVGIVAIIVVVLVVADVADLNSTALHSFLALVALGAAPSLFHLFPTGCF